jgi:hypothetical protein
MSFSRQGGEIFLWEPNAVALTNPVKSRIIETSEMNGSVRLWTTTVPAQCLPQLVKPGNSLHSIVRLQPIVCVKLKNATGTRTGTSRKMKLGGEQIITNKHIIYNNL